MDLFTIQKQEANGRQSSPELQFQIVIACFLDWHDNLCMLDLKKHNLLTCVGCDIGYFLAENVYWFCSTPKGRAPEGDRGKLVRNFDKYRIPGCLFFFMRAGGRGDGAGGTEPNFDQKSK